MTSAPVSTRTFIQLKLCLNAGHDSLQESIMSMIMTPWNILISFLVFVIGYNEGNGVIGDN